MEALKFSLDAETAVLEYWQVSNLLLSGTLICHRLTVEPVVDFADGYGASTWPPTWADSRCDWRELWFNLRVEPPSWVAGDMAIAAGGINLVVVCTVAAADSLRVHDPKDALPQNQGSRPR